MLEEFEKSAPVMILFRPHANRTVFECVAWLQASREGPRGTDFLSKLYRPLKHSVSWGRLVLGKAGRRGVGRLTH